MELMVSTDIGAPPSAVWDVIIDLDGSPAVLSAVERIERLDGAGGFRVGTRWLETRTMFGKTATEEMQVTSIEPGTSYEVTSVSGGTTYTSVLRIEEPTPDRSRLTMTFAATTTGFGTRLLGATIGRLMQGATRRMLERDLADIAAAAQGRTS